MATAVRAPSTAPKNDFLGAIALLAAEKNLPKEGVFEAVEAALASAYKKDALANSNLICRIDGGTGGVRVFAQKEGVEEVEDDKVQITLDEAKEKGVAIVRTQCEEIVAGIRDLYSGVLFKDLLKKSGKKPKRHT